MSKYFWLTIAVTAVAANAGLAAKPTPKPKPIAAAKHAAAPYIVIMQSAGTFEPAAPGKKIAITVSPEEIEPASFTVKSAKNLSDVTFKVSNLVNGNYILPSSKITIAAVQCDQLIPLTPFAVQPGISTQFWATINVPNRTAPGTYTGQITAVAGGKAVGKLPVEVTILAMRLLKSSKQYGYSLRTPADSQMLAKLPDYGIGLTSVCAEPEKVTDSIVAIRAAGLGSTIP